MYNITVLKFVLFMGLKPPFKQVCNIFYIQQETRNFEVLALNSESYEYLPEPLIEGFSIVASVLLGFLILNSSIIYL